MKFCLFFLVVFSSYATITTPFELEIASGYREDHLKWRLQEPGDESTTVYREKYSNLKFVETEISIQKITRDILFYCNGGYATIGKDHMEQSGFDLTFTNQPVEFLFGTSGTSFHTTAYLGYEVQLAEDRHYEINLAPIFGFTYIFEKIRRKDPNPNPFVGELGGAGDFFTIFSSLKDKNFQQKWYGVFLGVELFARPTTFRYSFSAGYRYHWLSLRYWFFSHLFNEIYEANILTLQEINELSGKVSKNGNLAHFGYIQFSGYPNRYIKLSLKGTIQYFSSKVANVQVKNTIEQIFPISTTTQNEENRKFKSRWLIFQVLLQISFYI